MTGTARLERERIPQGRAACPPAIAPVSRTAQRARALLAAAGLLLPAGVAHSVSTSPDDRCGASAIVRAALADSAFVLIPSGTFRMGSSRLALERRSAANQHPPHTVSITRPFRLQRVEVTNDLWRDVMGAPPSANATCGQCPVERVTWSEVQHFLRSVSRSLGVALRLPTEAEWEYVATYADADAAHDGATGDLSRTDWFVERAAGTTHAVGSSMPNVLGLHDLHGNVSEWVQDWYDAGYYAVSPRDDPKGPSQGIARAVRGGNVLTSVVTYRPQMRLMAVPDARLAFVGFRVVRGE